MKKEQTQILEQLHETDPRWLKNLREFHNQNKSQHYHYSRKNKQLEL